MLGGITDFPHHVNVLPYNVSTIFKDCVDGNVYNLPKLGSQYHHQDAEEKTLPYTNCYPIGGAYNWDPSIVKNTFINANGIFMSEMSGRIQNGYGVAGSRLDMYLKSIPNILLLEAGLTGIIHPYMESISIPQAQERLPQLQVLVLVISPIQVD